MRVCLFCRLIATHFLYLYDPEKVACSSISNMEAKIAENFLPDLVTAISDCVQPVSDQCLAKGLISDSVYKRVLESGGTSEDKARILILAVNESAETDGRCLEILLRILDKQLTHMFTVKEKLLSEIRKELIEKAKPAQTVQFMSNEELIRETSLLQASLLEKFEDVVRQHERACTEKRMLEEKLKTIAKSSEKEFEISRVAAKSVLTTQSLATDCEHELETLKERISKLEHTIEERGMKVKRDCHVVVLENERMLEVIIKSNKSAEREEARGIEEHKLTVDTQEIDSRIKQLEQKIKEYESPQTHGTVPADRLSDYEIRRLHGPQSIRWSPHWRNIGSHLGFTTEELDEIDSGKDKKKKDKLFKMLHQWVQWYPGDKRGSTNFATYSDLQAALMKDGLTELICEMYPYTTLCTFYI